MSSNIFNGPDALRKKSGSDLRVLDHHGARDAGPVLVELDDGVGVAALLVHRSPHVPHRVAAVLHDRVGGGQLHRHVLLKLAVGQGVESVLKSSQQVILTIYRVSEKV